MFKFFHHTILFSNKKNVVVTILSFLSVVSFHLAVSMRESVLLSIAHGASFIPFIKTYITLPSTFLIGAFYLILQKRVGTVKTYTIINLGLLCYFVLFSIILLPYYEYVTPSVQTIAYYKTNFHNFRFFICIIEHWPCALFHVVAEIWSIYIFIILFWQVANETFSHKEAATYYPIIATLIGIGTTVAAYPIAQLGKTENPSIAFLCILIPLSLSMNSVVYFIHRTWGLEEKQSAQIKRKESEKPTLFQAVLKILDNNLSPQVLSLSVCLFSFNFLICLFETCFWARVSVLYSTQNELLSFYSSFTFLKGCFSLVAGILNIYLLRRIGWKAVLSITPIICVFAIHLFLLFSFPQSIFKISESYSLFENISGIPIILTWFFAVCLSLSYASKFSFFDPTKEIIISSLDSEERRFSKVFADGISGRAGKIIGSVVQSMLLSLSTVDSILDLSHILFFFAFLTSIVFISGIRRLQSGSQINIPNQTMKTAEES